MEQQEPLKKQNQEINSGKMNKDYQKDIEETKMLIEQARRQLEEEKQKINDYKMKMYEENDFKVSKFVAYDGPNFYMDRKALVFNIFIAPVGDSVDFYRAEITKTFPQFKENTAKYTVDLFADVVLELLRMDINLYINKYEISYDDDEFVIAVEYLDKDIAEDCVCLASDWFFAISNDKEFPLMEKWNKLQQEFDKTFYGGPTLYSLIESGLKRDIPVFYLFEENEFQWGYSKKQLRGRSTTFHTDGIKDTEFTMFKDMVGDFLDMCGFPTPKTINTFTEDEAVEASKEIGFPCVVKPVAGHKGQGVTTGIESEQGVRDAFQNILKIYQENEIQFDGALVQTQVFGTDHRLLSVNGKFAAALERVPAFVDGDGKNTIEKLIETENTKLIRLDNARSPLCKIKIDEDLLNFLSLQNLTLQDIPAEGTQIVLRRVANISAGGVSINVTEKIHQDNIQLVEDIASFFKVKCMGIDVLAKDISVSWKEGNFGIIEINAGPGVFMHLAPAYGGSLDIPALIMKSHFGEQFNGRIPIIAANTLSKQLYLRILEQLKSIKPEIKLGALLTDGVHFNDRLFYKNPDHIQNQKIILRHPDIEFAVFTHDKDHIYDYGLFHYGADIIVLDQANYAEEAVLLRQLFPSCPSIEADNKAVYLVLNDEKTESRDYTTNEEKENIIFEFICRYLPDLLKKY